MRLLAEDKKRRNGEQGGAAKQGEENDMREYDVDQVLFEVEKEIRSCDLD